MGNNPSKKAGKERPKSLPPRLELPDNDYSTNTASQQQQQQQQQQQSALSQLNPNYPTGRKGSPPPGATSDGPEMESPEEGNADNDVDSNQLTVNSINQLTVSSMISINGKTMDIDDYIHRLLEAGYAPKVSKQLCLKNAEVNAICRAAMDVFLSQPSLIELTPPVKIVGDVHGQYTDLIRDYVNRGKQSLETFLLLLCYKLKFPENFFILRGNHECANVTRVYGFYDECKRRCSPKIWKTFVDVFNTLPIAALVAGKIFCVHGGLSPSMHSMDEIRNIQRPTDVPDYGLLNDLLWSDPSETAVDWEDNERGVSYCFGKKIINEFLAKFDLDLVCRAHMVVEDGYEFFNERTLVTVFSAPNYCGEFDNFGAIMSVSEELLCSFELLTPADHPLAKERQGRGKRRASPPMQDVRQSI
ncbi:unnamed protein product [Umbelopsis vinacea]